MYFTYMGKSMKTILDEPLVLVAFDEVTDVIGSNREMQKGETGIYRSIANEYSATYTDNAKMEYALVKSNYSPFTNEEKRIVERWLTSPKISQWLQLYDCDDNTGDLYCGIFTATTWKVINGFVGLAFTFEANSSYPFKKYALSFDIDESKTIDFTIYNDETEEPVYPCIDIFASKETSGEIPIIIKNLSDNKELKLNALNKLHICIDCKNNRLSDGTTEGVIHFKDIGWQDIDNIYWMKFYDGKNHLDITLPEETNVKIKITYLGINKSVGGWL